MADDIEIHFDRRRRELALSCGGEAFARIRDAVVAAADLGDAGIEGVPSEVQLFLIAEAPTEKPLLGPRARLRDRIVLLGCALFAFGLLFVFGIGMAKIAGWLR